MLRGAAWRLVKLIWQVSLQHVQWGVVNVCSCSLHSWNYCQAGMEGLIAQSSACVVDACSCSWLH